MERIRSIESPEAGYVLSADPREYKINDEKMVLYFLRRLQLPILNKTHKCHLCGKFTDASVEHPMRCQKIGRNTLHYQVTKYVVGIISKIYRNSLTTVNYEENLSHLRKPHCDKEVRVEIVTRNQALQQNMIIDLTFPITNSQATEENSTVRMAEKRKEKFYDDNLDYQNEFKLVVGALDTYGRWGEQFKNWVTFVGRSGLSEHQGAVQVRKLRTAIGVMHANVLGEQQIKFLKQLGKYDPLS